MSQTLALSNTDYCYLTHRAGLFSSQSLLTKPFRILKQWNYRVQIWNIAKLWVRSQKPVLERVFKATDGLSSLGHESCVLGEPVAQTGDRVFIDARESINMIRNIIKQVQNYFFWEPWNEIREKLVIRSKAGNRGEFPLTLFSLGSGKKTCCYHFLHMACLQNEQRISKRLPSPLSSKMK